MHVDVQHLPSGLRITGDCFAYPAGPHAGKLAIGGVDFWEFLREHFRLHYANPAYMGEVEISITIVEPPDKMPTSAPPAAIARQLVSPSNQHAHHIAHRIT